MDRKLCVLVYSQYSPACKTFVEYLNNGLQYDIARVTGMTFLNADNDECRNRLHENGIDRVPCILIEYFDGKKVILVDEDIYKFVSSVTRAINYNNNNTIDQEQQQQLTKIEEDGGNIIKRSNVMSAAAAYQKQRDDMIELERSPPSLPPSTTTSTMGHQQRTSIVKQQ